MRTRGLAVLVATALSAAVLAGCGGDNEDTASGTFTPGGETPVTGSPSPSGPAPAPSVKHVGGPVVMKGPSDPRKSYRAVQQAWTDFYAAYADAVAVADPDLADWKSRMTPVVFRRLRSSVAQLKTDRQIQKGPIVVRPVVLVVAGSTARLSDCVDVSRVVTYDSAGKRVSGESKQIWPVVATLRRTGDDWQVSQISSGKSGSCS